MHNTKEERSKSKYYCNECDTVFFSLIYYNKHMTGIKHSNQLKVNELSQNNFIIIN